MSFEYLPHTADITVRATGKTFGEALQSACQAFTNILTEVTAVAAHETREITVSGKNRQEVLFGVISKLVYLLDTEGFVPASATFTERDLRVHGVLTGDNIQHYDHHGDIKAITYHAMAVREEHGSVVLQFTLDI